MTTIAYRDGVLAADSQITMGDTRYAQCSKVVKLPNGALAAGCGSAVQCARLLTYMENNNGEWTDDILRKCPDAYVLYIWPDGKVFILEGGKRGGCAPMKGEYFAEGSGFVAALAAMKAGATAVRAIEIAAELDINTALPVESVRLGPIEGPAPKKRRRNQK
jgi:ATP-dependent HslUV protease subunit HslV